MKSMNEHVFDAWKQQAEFGMKLIEAMVQVNARLRGMQQAAAAEAQRRALEAGKAMANAKDPQTLWRAQYEMTIRNCEDAAAYWRNVFEAMSELNGRMLECVKQGTPKMLPQAAASEESMATALTVPGGLALRLWSDMYRQVDTFTRSLTEAVGAGLPAAKATEKRRKQEQAGA